MSVKVAIFLFSFRTIQDCLSVSLAVKSLALEGIPLTYKDCKCLSKVREYLAFVDITYIIVKPLFKQPSDLVTPDP